MARRLHLPALRAGEIPLDPVQAHHARHVLRLGNGAEVDVFDDAGATARATLLHVGPAGAAVRIAEVNAPAARLSPRWSVASAVPKGERADWMVEKLSELGAAAFIPLAAERSVVLPQGRGKHERWVRIATESAKQSRRAGVMRIDELTPLPSAIQNLVAAGEIGWFLATEVKGLAIREATAALGKDTDLELFIGPEGGWTTSEIALFTAGGIIPVRLGDTILRTETAAIAAGAIVAALLEAGET